MFRKVKETSLTEFQALILSSKSDKQLAALLQKKLNLDPSFIEGALRRAVTISKVDLLRHTLEVNKLLPHDSSMKANDEMLLELIQRAVNLHEFEVLECLIPFLPNSRALIDKCHLQNLAIHAVHLGFTEAVQLLCNEFSVCLEQTSQGHILTHTLARYSDPKSVGLLEEVLSRRVNVNLQEPSGDTALHVAVRERNIEAVKLLLGQKACTEILNNSGDSPKTLCDEPDITPLLNNAESPSSISVSLYIAVESGNREMVQHVLNSGVPIDTKWVKGRTALSAACIKGDIAMAELLLEKRASAFPIGNFWPEIPPALALSNKHYELAVLLLRKTEETYTSRNDTEKKHIRIQLIHLLHNCAQVGAVDVARFILNSTQYGINAGYEFLNTLLPIHTACKYGQIDIIKLLLEYRVDSNAGTQTYFNTPLHYACFYGNIDIAQLLLTERGVDIDGENRQLETPLYCVLRGQLSSQEKGRVQESAVIFLIMNGAKLYKPGRRNCELAHFNLRIANQRWEFIPFHTQKLIIVVRDVAKPCTLSNLARFAVRSAIQVPLTENTIDATGLSYRMQNYVLLKDWFPTL